MGVLPEAPAIAATYRRLMVRPSAAEGLRQRLLAGAPVTERRVGLAGVATALLEAGAGPPLVLLHGGIECGGVYWAPAIARLAERNRVIAPDVPGLGESDPIARLDDVAFADWFGELLRATCKEPPTLIAHSLLGSLAARFATAHGGLLRRLVVYAAPGVGPYRMPLGLRAVAVRFGLRPTARNAERFDRWAFYDFDRALQRERGVAGRVQRLHATACDGPARQADHAAPGHDRDQADPRHRAAPQRGPDRPAVGQARPLRPARPGRGGERQARLAAAGDRRRRSRPPHRADRRVPRRPGRSRPNFAPP